MLDAIGIKLLDASAPRAEPRQDSGRQEQAPPAGSTAAAAAGGPYYSPVLRLDSETQRTVIQYRDVSTGKVQIQYPSERQLEAYRVSQRQREEEAEMSSDGQGAGPQAEAGRPPRGSAAPGGASGPGASGSPAEERGGSAGTGSEGAQAPVDANRPAARLAAITA
jgi:hypothetical protein